MRRPGLHGRPNRLLPDRRGGQIARAVAAVRARPALGLGALAAAVALIAAAVLVFDGSDTASKGSSGGVKVVAARESVKIGDRTWHVVQGDWAVDGNTLAIKKPGRLYASMIVTDGGSEDVSVQATMRVVASGAGLVFRYQDPFNHWALEAVQGVVSWQLIKVVGGKSQIVANTGLSPTTAGTVVAVATRTNGTIDVSFNGKLRKSFSDPALASKRSVGFLAYGSRAGRAVFTDFTTTPLAPA